MTSTILEMRDITKTFPGVKALSNVNLSVEEGEIHAVVGENGAGKSTLMKVLSGVYPSGTYDGEIVYRGQECHFKGIHDSEQLGHRHHPPGAGAGADAVDRREHLPRQRAGHGSASSTGTPTRRAPARCCKKVGLQRRPRHADHQYRRRQAAAGRDRQGAEQGSQAADPRRADGQPVREGQPGAARPAARIQARRASPRS